MVEFNRMITLIGDKKMESMTRLRIMRLLTESDARIADIIYEDIPAKYKNRAETIRNKIVDLTEDIRECQTTG